MLHIVGVYPQCMMVHVYVFPVYGSEMAPAVRGFQHRYAHHKNMVAVVRIHPDLPEIVAKGVHHLIQVVGMGAFPGLAAVVGTVHLRANYRRVEQLVVSVFQIVDQGLWRNGFGAYQFKQRVRVKFYRKIVAV